MLTAVTGINWGDEEKGRVIDLLAEQSDVAGIVSKRCNKGDAYLWERYFKEKKNQKACLIK